MKKTVFESAHISSGARMTLFAGFNMPIEYTGLTKEHLAVRNGVGVFDVSHMGEIWIKGDKALPFLQYITTNDVSVLIPGRVQYSCMPNGKGGIVDDILIYCYSPDKYMMVVNASNLDKDYEWILKQNQNFGAEIENASEKISQIAVQGPRALDTLQKLTDTDLKSIPYYHFKTEPLAGIKEVIISNTGYTGAGGFELYFYNSDAMVIWDAVMEAGKEFDIVPAGLGARDTLRLEKGFALYGNDIDDTTSPIEAGLGWITKFNKDFIDRPLLEKQKKEGISRKLVGFEMIDRGIPRHGYDICDKDGNKTGIVTSGTMSPSLNKAIGMGYVPATCSVPGTEIYLSIRNKILKAIIVNTPFLK